MIKDRLRKGLLIVFITCASIKANAQHESIIVTYLDVLSKMMVWPNEPHENFVIAVLGESTSIPALQKRYSRKWPKRKVRRQQVRFVAMKDLSQYVSTNLLFTETKNLDSLRYICEDLNTTNVVIVTCVPGFNEGPTINIDLESNYEVQINAGLIEARDVRIGPVLKELAEIL